MIKRAKSAGFCMGVRRALDIVDDVVRAGGVPLYTDGPLIHNPQIVSLLEGKGIRSLKEGETPREGGIVIRAHGVSPGRRRELESYGLPIYDATCPNVSRVQRLARRFSRQGYDIAIVGDRGHAEVEGLLGFSEGRGIVVSSLRDAGKIRPGSRVCVLAQTTQDERFFKRVAGRIMARAAECVVCDTICRSTKKRQGETISLARNVDAVVVVGGRNSANTARLVKICEEEGAKAFHVESEDELKGLPLEKFERIGVTAGASTPPWLVDSVVERIKRLKKGKGLGD